MVERIKKVEPDRMRIQRKEDPRDDQHGKSGQEQAEEERDSFAPKLDVKKLVGEETASAGRHPSLWERRLTPRPAPAEGTHETTLAGGEGTSEEVTVSTTITFLRAAGLINRRGTPRWGTIALYFFALIGFLFTVIFLLSALL